jgi:type II secretory pathway component GspD/PulD (secretin)
VDEASNSVLVTGPAEKLAKAREILRSFDTGREKVAVGQPFLKMYPVAGGNAEAISKILQEAYKSSPSLKVAAVNSTTIAVWAGPEMQIRIAREILPGQEETNLTSKAEFIPLTLYEAQKMATFLWYAFPTEKGKSGPVIDADVGRNGVLVYGTEQQRQEVRKAIVAIEGQDPSSAGMRVVTLERGSAAVLAEALKALLEKARPDLDVKVILPGSELVKPEPEKKPAPPKQFPKTGRARYPISNEGPRQAGLRACYPPAYVITAPPGSPLAGVPANGAVLARLPTSAGRHEIEGARETAQIARAPVGALECCGHG